MKLFQSSFNLLSRNSLKNTLYPLNRLCSSDKLPVKPENSKESISNETQTESTVKLDRPDRLEYNSAIENEFIDGVQISSYTVHGFRLNKYVQVLGPIIVFPKTVFSWNVKNVEAVTPESLSIFNLVEPKIETLIIGTGEHETRSNICKTILDITHRYKLNVEILSTEMACSQFNFLSSEGRMVAAALIPPQDLTFCEDDIFVSHATDGKLFHYDHNIHLK